MGGSTNKGAALSPRPRDPVNNANDPRGQLGRFLRAWIDEHYDGDESKISEPMGISERAVRKWCEGNAAPSLSDFAKLAKVLKFRDWAALALEVVAFSKSKNR
jgi:hypothetical protein